MKPDYLSKNKKSNNFNARPKSGCNPDPISETMPCFRRCRCNKKFQMQNRYHMFCSEKCGLSFSEDKGIVLEGKYYGK